MIRFSLHCDQAHEFEGWFRDNADYDEQARRGFVECPVCASSKVSKALMAPSVSTGRKKEKMALMAHAEQRQMMKQLKELTDRMRENSDYVGDKFAEEARKIHFGETEARGIHGEATAEEARGLIEDGVEFLPIPVLPEDQN